jgi:tetratricopeptide (TPR) repeat protein
MVRSKVLERIGGLDERCGTTKSAFTNFSLRASLTGWETRLCRGGVSRSEAVGKDSSEALGSVIDNWCLHWGLSTGEGAGAEGLISRHHIPLAYPGALLCAETGGNRWKGSRREDLAVLKKRAEISRQGVRLFKEGKLKDAEQCFRRLTSDGTDYPGAHGNLACVLMKLGRLDEALDEMRISRKLEPDDANILWNYGQLLFQAGDGPAALEAYEEYLRVHPQDERIRTGCERLKARVGKG